MYTNMYDEYEQYVKKYKAEYGDNTIVLYRCGSFYEIYSANDGLIDIKYISELLNIQVSRRNKAILDVDRSNFNMAGFPMFALKKFVNMLIEASFTVVIVDQVSDPPKPKRAVTEIISPGTNIDQYQAFDAPFLLVAYFEEHKAWKTNQNLLAIGISIIDLTTGNSKLCEYVSTLTDPNLALDQLYKINAFYQPREIVLTSAQPITHTFAYLKTYLDIEKACVHDKIMSFPDVMTKLSYQEQLLRKIFPKHGLLNIIEFLNLERLPLALHSFSFLLDFCHKHNENILRHITPPEIINETNNLLLSFNASKQINIQSLCQLLNQCETAIGKRSFKERLLSPQTDPDILKNKYDDLQNFIPQTNQASFHLSKIYDLERLFRRISLRRIHPADFTQIESSLSAVLDLDRLKPFPDNIQIIKSFLQDLTTHLDLQDCQKYHLDNISQSFFQPTIYPHLDELQSEYTKLKSIFEVLAKNIHIDFAKVDYNDRDGFYVTMTAKRFNDIKTELKNKTFKAYEYEFHFNQFTAKPISAASTNLKITDPVMKQINHKLEEAKTTLSAQVFRQYIEFVDQIEAKYQPSFRQIIDYIINIDWLTSCAKTANNYKYTRPTLTNIYQDKSYIEAKQMRHPIIERILTFEQYVPNDITIGTDKTRGILLYGINSAGKSSISKAVALNVIMAQAGMFVPCDEFTFWPYKEIFTRIPSGDDMMKGQSTFVVEITELRNILKRATRNSLVIGDELASGTESISALAIVSAGIVELYNRQSSFIFATHLHDLPSISHIKQLPHLGIYHLGVTYDESQDKLIYQRTLLSGQGHSLYGLEVCKSLNLGTQFMTLANEVRQEVLDIIPNALSTKSSKYNANYFVDTCSLCGENATEVHHIQYQSTANEEGFIGHIHKNNLSNLMCVCESCHYKIHHGEISITGYRQTTQGIELIATHPAPRPIQDIKAKVNDLRQQNKSIAYIAKECGISAYKAKKLLELDK